TKINPPPNFYPFRWRGTLVRTRFIRPAVRKGALIHNSGAPNIVQRHARVTPVAVACTAARQKVLLRQIQVQQLIVKPAPDILFVYEGDNDVAGHKKTGIILKQVKELTSKIQKDLPQTRLVYISPKPCFARESLKKDYIKLNKKLEKFCSRKKSVDFVDVWQPMHDEAGNLYNDIFLDDRLHMNKKGYDIWGKVINDFLEQ
ncbi:MAG: hypothetical protein EOM73_07560, partial [Bacteroidia bacterium]|nr:hypothetical protein [Bacteroidia bacterium]